MNCFRIETRFSDIDELVRFYAAILGKAPASASADGATWSFDDPQLEFTISKKSASSRLPF